MNKLIRKSFAQWAKSLTHNPSRAIGAMLQPLLLPGVFATATLVCVGGDARADPFPHPIPDPNTSLHPYFKWEDKPVKPPPTSGVHGINRTVRIKEHGAITGIFSEPSFPVNHPANKPTFYLGVDAGRTVSEAGLQWEPELNNNGVYTPEGWRIFQRVTYSYYNESPPGKFNYWNNSPRIAKGALGSTTLTLQPESTGRLKIFANSSGSAGFNTMPSAFAIMPKNGNAVDTSRMEARRNVGVTQYPTGGVTVGGTTIQFDDYYAENFNFIEGRVARITSSNSGVLSIGNFYNWPQNSPLNSERLAPPGKRNGSPPYALDDMAPFIIDFQPPSVPRVKLSGDYTTNYRSEKVVVDLRANPGFEGRNTVPGKPDTGE